MTMSSFRWESLVSGLIPGVRPSLGVVLVGTVVGSFFSGIVAMQAFLYYRTYTQDQIRFKLAVGLIWILDLLHTSMACAANWEYLIENFGNEAIPDHITWPIAVTIALTAIITFLVHCFFAHRILTLSKHNWYITGPIVVLALARLVLALVSTLKMIELGSYHDFVHMYEFIFTSGLSLAAAVDVPIAAALIWYLNHSRTGFSDMDTILDSIKLYAIENGLLTSVTTVVSLICWVSMPHNLIFLGLHFVISKLYANALLATLNARKVLRGRASALSDRSERPMPVHFPDHFTLGPGGLYNSQRTGSIPSKVQISVEKTVEHDRVINVQSSSDLSVR